MTRIKLMHIAQENGIWQEPKNKSKKELERCHIANKELMETMIAIFNLGARCSTRGLQAFVNQRTKNIFIK